jgi:hypothetical protein
MRTNRLYVALLFSDYLVDGFGFIGPTKQNIRKNILEFGLPSVEKLFEIASRKK